jgi:hypothetical protein
MPDRLNMLHPLKLGQLAHRRGLMLLISLRVTKPAILLQVQLLIVVIAHCQLAIYILGSM